jgi:hypothetical protein
MSISRIARSLIDINSIAHGIVGGWVGGVVFGIMMGKMGVLPMIGAMVGQPTVFAGWVVHLVISAVIGGSFGFLFGRYATSLGRSLKAGLGWGVVWWFLGPLTTMPLFLGMGLGANWNLAAATNALPSLVGHIIFGALLGGYYGLFGQRAFSRGRLDHHGALPANEA